MYSKLIVRDLSIMTKLEIYDDANISRKVFIYVVLFFKH